MFNTRGREGGREAQRDRGGQRGIEGERAAERDTGREGWGERGRAPVCIAGGCSGVSRVDVVHELLNDQKQHEAAHRTQHPNALKVPPGHAPSVRFVREEKLTLVRSVDRAQ